MSASSLQLALETVLKTWIVAQSANPFFTAANIHCGHGAETLNEETSDYLSIIASLPRGSTPGHPEPLVRFELVTSAAEEALRTSQVQAHANRLSALIDLFTFDDSAANEAIFQTRLAALTAAAAASGFGFTGWERSPEPDEDGTTEKNQLVAKLSFTFELYLL
jgi:hypothetical protein